MTHKIALVHGMGTHGEDWSIGVQDRIKKQFEQLKSGLTPDFDTLFEFVEINYDVIFEAQRVRWKEQANQVLENLKVGGISAGALEELVEATQRLGIDNIFTTHILDVVLYKWFPLLAGEVRLTVAQTFLETAKAGSDWSVIAHSLGSAIVHDTLQAMFTQKVDGTLLPRSYRPSSIWMIANVSRVVSDNQVYRSLVKPTINIEHGLCEEYFSARHEFDPIPMVRPFQSENPDAIIWREEAGGLYHHIPIKGKNTRQLNVHAFSHYLEIPNLFVPLMRSLAGRNSIDKSKLAEFAKAYDKKTIEGTAKDVRDKSREINSHELSTIEGFLQALRLFYEFLTSLDDSD